MARAKCQQGTSWNVDGTPHQIIILSCWICFLVCCIFPYQELNPSVMRWLFFIKNWLNYPSVTTLSYSSTPCFENPFRLFSEAEAVPMSATCLCQRLATCLPNPCYHQTNQIEIHTQHANPGPDLTCYAIETNCCSSLPLIVLVSSEFSRWGGHRALSAWFFSLWFSHHLPRKGRRRRTGYAGAGWWLIISHLMLLYWSGRMIWIWWHLPVCRCCGSDTGCGVMKKCCIQVSLPIGSLYINI